MPTNYEPLDFGGTPPQENTQGEQGGYQPLDFGDAQVDESTSASILQTQDPVSELIQEEKPFIGNEGLYAIDADTFGISGSDNRYRLAGVDAREISKIVDGDYKFGQLGGQEQKDYVIRLANRYGYTKVKPTGQVDPFGREIADLVNARGESFTHKLISENIVDLHKDYATIDQVTARDYGQLSDLFKTEKINRGEDTTVTAWDLAAADLNRTLSEGGLAPKLAPVNEAQFAEAERVSRELGIDNPYSASRIQFRRDDRDELNVAYSPFGAGWEAGYTGLAQGWYGAAQLIGATIDSDWLQQYGAAGVVDLQHSLDSLPDGIQSYKDVHTIGDAWSFVSYLAGSSSPYLINTLLSTGVGAAAGTLVGGPLGTIAGAAIGLASPSLTYAGQTWIEMGGNIEDRNAGLALASGVLQGTLDRIGVKGIASIPVLSKFAPKGDNFLGDAIQYVAKKEGISTDQAATRVLNEVAEKYAKDSGISLADAKKVLADASKQEIAELTKDIAGFAANQITRGRFVKDSLVALTSGAAREGTTEVLQETVAYNSAILGSGGNKVFDFDEYQDRVVNALIGGGVLGGGLGSFSAVRPTLEWQQIKHDYSEADPTKRTAESIGGERLRTELGINSNDEVIAYAETSAPSYKTGALRHDGSVVTGLDQKYGDYEKTEAARTWTDWAATTFLGFGNPENAFKYIRSAAATGLTNAAIKEDPALAGLASLFGGRKAGIVSGPTAEEYSTQKAATLKNIAPDKDRVLLSFGLVPIAANKKKVVNAYRELVDNVLLPEAEGRTPTRENLSDFTRQHETSLRNLYNQFEAAYAEEYKVKKENAKEAGEELGEVKNYAAKHRSIAKDRVYQHRERVISDLKDTYGLSTQAATDLVQRMVDTNSFDTDFTQLKQFQPKNTRKRTLGLSEATRPDGTLVFDYILNTDPWTNYDNAVNASVNRNTILKYFGKDGAKANALIEEALKNGSITQAEANRIGFYAKNMIDVMDGNYKPVKSPVLKWLNKTVSTWGVVLYGPGFLIASLPEMANVAATSRTLDGGFLNETKKVALGMTNGIFRGTKEIGEGIYEIAKRDIKEWPEAQDLPRQTPFYAATLKERFEQSGFGSVEVGQKHITGVGAQEFGDPGSWRNQFASGIFVASGLVGYTDLTRKIRMSLFDDEVWDLVRKLSTYNQGDPWLQKHQRARDELASLGMDADTLVRLYKDGVITPDKVDQIPGDSQLGQWLHNQWITGSNRWTDYAIPSPAATNRPLIYNNPRFRLLLLFQGFISTFTAIHLPRMYQRAKNQGALMSFNVFSQVAALAAIAYLAQMMKDYAIYGDEEKPLDEGQKVYRAIQKTGLMGTPERVVSFLFPLYEDRTTGIEGAAKGILGEFGTIGNLAYNVGKGATQVVDEDPQERQRGLNNILRGAPLTSIHTPLRHELVKRLTGSPFGTAQ